MHSLDLVGTDKECWRKDCEYIDQEMDFQARGDEEERTSLRTKKRLQDVLMEPQSDSDLDLPSSDYSPLDNAVEESGSEVSGHQRFYSDSIISCD